MTKGKSTRTPSRLVRLTREELAQVGYGKLGRFPTADIYNPSVSPADTTPRNEAVRDVLHRDD